MTLDQIEHDILRKRFKGPRVHFAVNCASKSCPPLQGEPFSGSLLNDQLRDQLVNNKGRIKVKYLDYDWSLNGT